MAGADACDIAIVGGGPAGLILAISLQKALPGATIKVFERAQGYRRCGAGVSIVANGQKALEAIDPGLLQWCTQNSLEPDGSITSDHTGTVLKTTTGNPLATQEKFGRPGIVLGWYEVQQKFYSELPRGTVTLGSHFKGYSLEGETLKLEFEGKHPVSAKLLIGADGYFSAVRSQWLNDGPPTFAETVMWRARLPRWPGWEGNPSKVWFGDNRMVMQYPVFPDEVVWVASAPLAELQKLGVEFDQSRLPKLSSQGSGESAGSLTLERCLKVFSSYPDDVIRVMRETPPSAVVEHGLYLRTAESYPSEAWGSGPVTLVGDASHPLRPTGQGLNVALEDAAELAWWLKKEGICPAALRSFEKERLPRVATIAHHENTVGQRAYVSDGKAARESMSNDEFHSFLYGREFQAL